MASTYREAHESRNQLNLGQTIGIERIFLLENQSKSLHRFKKLQPIRSGPYTVTKHIANTEYEKQGEEIQQKRLVHRHQILECFPKENEIQLLTADYTNVHAEPDNFLTTTIGTT